MEAQCRKKLKKKENRAHSGPYGRYWLPKTNTGKGHQCGFSHLFHSRLIYLCQNKTQYAIFFLLLFLFFVCIRGWLTFTIFRIFFMTLDAKRYIRNDPIVGHKNALRIHWSGVCELDGAIIFLLLARYTVFFFFSVCVVFVLTFLGLSNAINLRRGFFPRNGIIP